MSHIFSAFYCFECVLSFSNPTLTPLWWTGKKRYTWLVPTDYRLSIALSLVLKIALSSDHVSCCDDHFWMLLNISGLKQWRRLISKPKVSRTWLKRLFALCWEYVWKEYSGGWEDNSICYVSRYCSFPYKDIKRPCGNFSKDSTFLIPRILEQQHERSWKTNCPDLIFQSFLDTQKIYDSLQSVLAKRDDSIQRVKWQQLCWGFTHANSSHWHELPFRRICNQPRWILADAV